MILSETTIQNTLLDKDWTFHILPSMQIDRLSNEENDFISLDFTWLIFSISFVHFYN